MNRRHIIMPGGRSAVALPDNAKVSDAVAQGDPDAAERAMNQHLSAAWPTWARQLGRN
jgi:DNA-binding FadR family transcriptional regulator